MQRNSQQRVATVIVTYNGEQWIDHCLQSLLASVYPTDIIVIDNCSTDRTVVLIKQKYPYIHLIENRDNKGFGQANNIGIRQALERCADYVFLMNQDAWVAPDAIGRLVEAAKNNEMYGILSPVHFNGKGNALDHGFAHYAGVSDYLQLEKQHGADLLFPLPFVNAAFWLIPAEVVRKVGGFDSCFFYCGEDVNWVHRLAFHGYKVGVVPLAHAFHDRSVRPLSHDKQLHLNNVYHWCEALNIQRSLFASFLYGPMALLKRWIVSLFFQWNRPDAEVYGKECIKMLTAWKRVMRHRSFYLHKQDFWHKAIE